MANNFPNELSFNALDYKEKYLKKLQKINLPKLKKRLTSLGYKIVKVTEVSDGWMTGFTIHKIIVKDKRSGVRDKDKTYTFFGSDDNTVIYEGHDSGGKGYFTDVPNAKKLKDIGYKRKFTSLGDELLGI